MAVRCAIAGAMVGVDNIVAVRDPATGDPSAVAVCCATGRAEPAIGDVADPAVPLVCAGAGLAAGATLAGMLAV
jgi:hypothetical protein